MSREERAQAEAAFAEADVAAIVATATLELGIDVGDLDLVQQLEAPRTVSSFLQRLGRTGRRGDPARMTFYATDAFHLVQAMAVIELAKRGWVESITPPRRAWHVLVHQLLVSALEEPGLVVSELYAKLKVAWPFADITEEELVGLVRHLASEEILEARGGTISLGPEGERRFSARNYFDLFAIFQGAREMSVRTENGDDIGTLQTSYVLTQGDGDFVFVLAGRRWQAVDVNGEAGVIWAKPAPDGKLPRWQSPMGGFVPRTVIEEHRKILASTAEPSYLIESAKQELVGIRETWADVAGEEGWVLRSSPKGVIVHSFAGGRVNLTLAKVLAHRLGCATSSDEYTVSVRGTEAVTTNHVGDELRRFAAEGFADDLRAAVAASLPRRPLSKFQPLLPPIREREFLETRVFAFDDATVALQGHAIVVGANG